MPLSKTHHRRRHVTPFWRLIIRRWLATAVCTLAVATIICGYVGFRWQYMDSTALQSEAKSDPPAKQPAKDWSIPVFKTVQLFLLNSGAEDDASHPSNWWMFFARLSAAALFLVVSSTAIIRFLDQVRRLPRLLTRSDHIVICGLGQIGLQLLDDLDAQGRARNVIVVEANAANSWVDYARNMGATVVVGDSTRADTHVEARTLHAAEVFIVNGDDGVNLEVAAEIGSLFEGQQAHQRAKPLQVYVHIVDTSFASTFRPYAMVLHNSPHMSVQVFNVPRTAAARLVTNQLWPYAPKQSHEVAHFVILGFGAMGQALAVQLAQLGHFPNRRRSRFTIADRDIAHSARSFLSRYTRFTSWTDGEHARLGVDSFPPAADAWDWNEHPVPAELHVDDPRAIQYVCNVEFSELASGRTDERFAIRLAKRFADAGVKPVIFICGQQDRDNFEAAVQLREQLACYRQAEVPIFVWLPHQPALAETLARSKNGRFIPFGECRSAASYAEITEPLRESIGRKIHDDYEAQSNKAGGGEKKQPWSALRDDFRESNRVAADHLVIKLAALGLQLHRGDGPITNPPEFSRTTAEQKQLLAEMEHYRWIAERLLAGWRFAPRGETPEQTQENKQRKLNPNLIAWEGLGEDREKDFDQIETVLRECQKDRFCLVRVTGAEA